MIVRTYQCGEPIFTPTCDQCGAELEEEYDFMDAVNAKKLAGWQSARLISGDWVDLCPNCKDKNRPTAADDFAGIGGTQ